MAMVPCRTCGTPISPQARSCPKCGAPVRRLSGCFIALLISFGALIAASLVIKAIQDSQPAPPRKTEVEEAVDACTAAVVTTYGYSSVTGWADARRANDVWRDHHGTGAYDSLWSVEGKNAFGMPVENEIECETSRGADGKWKLPFLWNITMAGDKLDPGTVDSVHPAPRRVHRHHSGTKAIPK